jgi:hypothetical protein
VDGSEYRKRARRLRNSTTPAGAAQAQKQFEAVFGTERTIDLRALLHAVAATDLGINAVSSEE